MPINIRIDNHGAIKCDPQSGHLITEPNQQIEWRGLQGAANFTLAFTDFKTGRSVWPFSDPPAPPNQFPNPFIGTLNGDVPRYYKYIVKVGDYTPLDPIIIVDRN